MELLIAGAFCGFLRENMKRTYVRENIYVRVLAFIFREISNLSFVGKGFYGIPANEWPL